MTLTDVDVVVLSACVMPSPAGGGKSGGADRQAGNVAAIATTYALLKALELEPVVPARAHCCPVRGKGESMSQSVSDNCRGVWGNRIGFGQRPALLMIDFRRVTPPGRRAFAPGVEAVAAAQACWRRAPVRDSGDPYAQIRYHPQHQQDGGIWVQKAR